MDVKDAGKDSAVDDVCQNMLKTLLEVSKVLLTAAGIPGAEIRYVATTTSAEMHFMIAGQTIASDKFPR